jgi:HlyD family secretion protein
MDPQEPTLPLADPGLKAGAHARTAKGPLPLALRLGVGGLLLVIGAVGGMYVQGPVVRLFFGLTGLEPGGGALRAPIAVAPAAPAPPPAPVDDIVALGRLQPLGSVIEVAAPTSAGAPRVIDVLVHEGDVVAFDAPLVVLDTYPQLSAGRDAARRAVEVAEATLVQAKRDVAVGRSEGGAAVDAARAAAAQAERERARQAELHASAGVSDAQLEAAEAQAAQAQAELRRAEAGARRFASDADITLAERTVEARRTELLRAEAELSTATVRAPSTGTVLQVHVQPGERAPSSTLISLADLSRMEAEIEVYQDAVPRLAVGQPVRIESPVLRAPLTGAVRRIGLEIGRQSLTGAEPAAQTDARVVKAWVDVDPASTAEAARYVGLEVIAHIDPEDQP